MRRYQTSQQIADRFRLLMAIRNPCVRYSLPVQPEEIGIMSDQDPA